MSKAQFSLITSGENYEGSVHFWTVKLPEQLHHFKSREEAMVSLAKALRNLLKGNFELREADLVTGDMESAICGGWRHLVDWLDKKEGKLTTSAILEREKYVKRPRKRRIKATRQIRRTKFKRLRKSVPRR